MHKILNACLDRLLVRWLPTGVCLLLQNLLLPRLSPIAVPACARPPVCKRKL